MVYLTAKLRYQESSMTKNKPPSQRQLKAGELIRRALAEILAKENIRDVDLQGVSVTISEVRASPDLKHARVYASPLEAVMWIKSFKACRGAALFYVAGWVKKWK